MMRDNVPGVYYLRHTASQRVYVGSSVGVAARMSDHRSLLRAGLHYNAALQTDWNTYGAGAFECVLAEAVTGDHTALIATERRHVERLRPNVYNEREPVVRGDTRHTRDDADTRHINAVAWRLLVDAFIQGAGQIRARLGELHRMESVDARLRALMEVMGHGAETTAWPPLADVLQRDYANRLLDEHLEAIGRDYLAPRLARVEAVVSATERDTSSIPFRR